MVHVVIAVLGSKIAIGLYVLRARARVFVGLRSQHALLALTCHKQLDKSDESVFQARRLHFHRLLIKTILTLQVNTITLE